MVEAENYPYTIDQDEVEQIIEEPEDVGEPMDEEEAGEDYLQYEDVTNHPSVADIEGETFEFEDDSVQCFGSHNNSVYCVDMHPKDETIIVTGGGDDKGYVWNRVTGEKMYELTGHSDSVIGVKFSNDGEYIASAGMDGKVKIWRMRDGSWVETLEGPEEVVCIQWHPKGNVIIAGGSDGTIWMWNIPSGSCMNVFTGHSDTVSQCDFTPNGQNIVSCSSDGSVILWDPKSANVLYRWTGKDSRFHSQGINTFAVKPDSQVLLTGGCDGSAKLLHLQNHSIIATFDNHTDSVETVGFCDVLPLIATGSIDGNVCIWDFNSHRLRHTCNHGEGVIRLQWHHQSPCFTTCSVDGLLRTWDGRTGECIKLWKGHQDQILDFVLSKDGQTVVTGSDDGFSLVFSTS